MKRILVLGATGMAGHLITLYFKKKNYDVTAFSNTPVQYCKNIVGDATDSNFFSKVIIEGQYDYIINCIGLLNKTCDEIPSKAVYLNSYLPHQICDFIKNSQTKLIHMSTDCVFSGKTGPYNENSFKDGETFYDKTKALGEIKDDKNLTFRNSIIGPDMNPNGIGLFNWFMKQKTIITGFNRVTWTGVTTLTLAKAMEKAMEQNLSGIYNLVNNESITKFEMLTEFNAIFHKNLMITENNDLQISKYLINNRKDFDFIVPSYHEMFVEMKDWIMENKEFYKHYF